MPVVEINDPAAFQAAIATPDKLVIVDFSAAWCGPCKMIAPIFEDLSNKNPHVVFCHIDIDNSEMEEIVTKFNVASVPTFFVFKDGKKIDNWSGANKAKLENAIKLA